MNSPTPRPAPKTPRELITELRGERCRCGAEKRRAETFCKRCYFSLPRALALALYKRVGEGYEDAYAAAAQFLDAKKAARRR